jgi:hypothetical protein
MAGHDTTEFRDAIRQILESITQLKSARDAAIAKFKQQWCCFTIIDKNVQRDMKADSFKYGIAVIYNECNPCSKHVCWEPETDGPESGVKNHVNCLSALHGHVRHVEPHSALYLYQAGKNTNAFHPATAQSCSIISTLHTALI